MSKYSVNGGAVIYRPSNAILFVTFCDIYRRERDRRSEPWLVWSLVLVRWWYVVCKSLIFMLPPSHSFQISPVAPGPRSIVTTLQVESHRSSTN